MAKRKQNTANGGGVATIDAEELTQRVQDDPDTELEDHEVRWLQDHDLLPDVWEKVPVTFIQNGQEVSNDPNFFAAQRLQDEDRFDAEVERRAEALAKEMLKAEMHEEAVAGTEYTGNAMGVPEQVGRGEVGFEADNSAAEEEEEGEGDYDSWHADELRAELSRRELSVSGNKAALIQRLQDDDNGLEGEDEGEGEE